MCSGKRFAKKFIEKLPFRNPFFSPILRGLLSRDIRGATRRVLLAPEWKYLISNVSGWTDSIELPTLGIHTVLGAICLPLLGHVPYRLKPLFLSELSMLWNLQDNLSTNFSRLGWELSADWSDSREETADHFGTFSRMYTELGLHSHQWEMLVTLATAGSGTTPMWSADSSRFIRSLHLVICIR
jgi:hypothetical protein